MQLMYNVKHSQLRQHHNQQQQQQEQQQWLLNSQLQVQ